MIISAESGAVFVAAAALFDAIRARVSSLVLFATFLPSAGSGSSESFSDI